MADATGAFTALSTNVVADNASWVTQIIAAIGSALEVGLSDWEAETAYDGDKVTPTTANGYYYECTTAGTSDTTEPTWPTTADATVEDGTATWTCRAITFSESNTLTVTRQRDGALKFTDADSNTQYLRHPKATLLYNAMTNVVT